MATSNNSRIRHPLSSEGGSTYVANIVTPYVRRPVSTYIIYRAGNATSAASTSAVTVNQTINGGAGNDRLLGGNGNDKIYGGAGDDFLDGGRGADSLNGGTGNDVYVVENTGDRVVEGLNEGIDTVRSTISFTLSANVENLTLIGGSAINGYGNNLNNVLVGNDGANILQGEAGDDMLYGRGGNDVIKGGAGNDMVSGGDGNDVLDGGADTDILYGGAGNDTLNGGTGADTMYGSWGDDVYVVDNVGDIVSESVEAGTDTVQTNLAYTLGANVENLTLTGNSAVTATGNNLNNVLIGNLANNTLNGGAGADRMLGGAGTDLYVVDNAGDVVIELAGEGVDTVQSSINYTLTTNVEYLLLTGSTAINGTGNALNNTLTGNSADNVLDGREGADRNVGGAGNDTYIIDNAGDTIVEQGNEGVDMVRSSISYTLGNNLENLTLTGSATIDGTGNTLDNVLLGNAVANMLRGGYGNDTLNGGGGVDSMAGEQGNDIYFVDHMDDVVTELAGQGVDTVNSLVNYTLSANVENLVLIGGSNTTGIGNAMNNRLTGSAANNGLKGAEGDDFLDGRGGSDVLTGGTGNDTYFLARGYGVDAIMENDSTVGNNDVAQFDADIAANQLWFRRVGNSLEVSVIGTDDKFSVNSWYLGSAYHVEQFKAGNGLTLQDTQVQNLVQAMAAFAPPAAGETTLSPGYQASLAPVLAANWH